MKKFSKIGKRVLAFFLVALMNINAYATTTANDGSSFVTKAEFDELVKDFNDKMDTYQSGLNAKIDYAIANYISGAAGLSQSNREIPLPNSVARGVLSISKKSPLDYEYGVPIFNGWVVRSDFILGDPSARISNIKIDFSASISATDNSIYKSKKTVVSNIKESTTAGASTARWEGYRVNCTDEVVCAGKLDHSAYNGYNDWPNGEWVTEATGQISNQNLVNSGIGLSSFRSLNGNGAMFDTNVLAINHDWGINQESYVSVLENYDYDMFSAYDRDKNWAYNGTYMTNFRGETWNNRRVDPGGTSQTITSPNQVFNKAFNGKVNILLDCISGAGTSPTRLTINAQNVQGGIRTHNTRVQNYYVPMVGFEKTFLTSWKQIYTYESSDIAKFENAKHSSESGFEDRGVLSDNNNDKYISLASGYPLMKLNRGERLVYTLSFQNKDVNYVVWFSNRPFKTTGNPDDDTACLTDITGLNKAENTSRGYLVTEGEGTFTTAEATEEYYLYIKWGINSADKADIAGGRLLPTQYGNIQYKG